MSFVMGKQAFLYVKSKKQVSCGVTVQLVSAFALTLCIVRFLYFLNLKCQTPKHLWLHRLNYDGPGQKPFPRKLIFSHHSSHDVF